MGLFSHRRRNSTNLASWPMTPSSSSDSQLSPLAGSSSASFQPRASSSGPADPALERNGPPPPAFTARAPLSFSASSPSASATRSLSISTTSSSSASTSRHPPPLLATPPPSPPATRRAAAAAARPRLMSTSVLDDRQDEDSCPICLELLSLRLAGEKPHVVPVCGHRLRASPSSPPLALSCAASANGALIPRDLLLLQTTRASRPSTAMCSVPRARRPAASACAACAGAT